MVALKTKNPRTVSCDTKDLQLFLAKKGDSWLSGDDPVVKQLVKGEIDDIRKVIENPVKMPAMWTIEDVLEANDLANRAPKSRQVHVLAVLPGAPMSAVVNESLVGPLVEDKQLQDGSQNSDASTISLAWSSLLSFFGMENVPDTKKNV